MLYLIMSFYILLDSKTFYFQNQYISLNFLSLTNTFFILSKG
jgi:hypothetical protein